MYTITKIRHVDRKHGSDLANSGKRKEGLDYIRKHTDVLEDFDTLLEARQCWRALGLTPGADFHATEQELYRLR